MSEKRTALILFGLLALLFVCCGILAVGGTGGEVYPAPPGMSPTPFPTR